MGRKANNYLQLFVSILRHCYIQMFIRLFLRKDFYFILPFLIFFTFIATKHLIAVPSSSETRIDISHSNDISFKQQLFHERLSSYNLLYNDSLPVCDKTNSLNNSQIYDFHRMSELLQTFRKQIIPYPNNSFSGRGIVLTAGLSQFRYAKLNLKMIEFTGTKLPVEVRLRIY
jgi:hypothetical protein